MDFQQENVACMKCEWFLKCLTTQAEQPEENAVAEEASRKRGGAKDAGPHTMSNATGHISLTMRIASYVMSSFIA